jgi:hypothetical protein
MVSVSVSSSVENKPGWEGFTDAPLACVELYNRSRTTENLGQVFYFPTFLLLQCLFAVLI